MVEAGGDGCTGGCCPPSTGIYAGAAFCTVTCTVWWWWRRRWWLWCMDVLVAVVYYIMTCFPHSIHDVQLLGGGGGGNIN